MLPAPRLPVPPAGATWTPASARHRPQVLQIIEIVGFLGEHVDDDAAVVQKDPPLAVLPFGTQDVDALAAQLEVGLVGQGSHMGGGGAGGNDEIVGDGGQVMHAEDADVARLFGVQRAGQRDGQVFAFH